MAVIQITSTNSKFSWIINKNPDTGIIAKSIRKGTSFGWFSNSNKSYNILFKDSIDEVSYSKDKDSEFEYLDLTRYNSPVFVNNAIDEFFKTVLRKKNENDIKGFDNSFLINNVFIKNEHYLKFFSTHFKERFIFEITKVSNKDYHIKISTNETLNLLINFSMLFAMFVAITNEDNIFVCSELITKYVDIANELDAPYFIRYLFKFRFILNKNKFNEFKQKLEDSKTSDIKLTYGDNFSERKYQIEKLISEYVEKDIKDNILDIGCGEGRFISGLASKIPDNIYCGIDIDESMIVASQKRCKNKAIDNAIFYDSLDYFMETSTLLDEKFFVVLTEVIEHMPNNEAKNLVKKVLNNIKFDIFIITTPDKRFNINYFQDDRLRHEDHKFEFNRNEFIKFIKECVGNKFNVEILDLGDVVDGISTSQMAVIKNK